MKFAQLLIMQQVISGVLDSMIVEVQIPYVPGELL